MLSKAAARAILLDSFPGSDVKLMAEYNGLYIFRAIRRHDTFEGDLDPFFSVNQSTGELRDFSVLTDISPADRRRLFQVDSKT